MKITINVPLTKYLKDYIKQYGDTVKTAFIIRTYKQSEYYLAGDGQPPELCRDDAEEIDFEGWFYRLPKEIHKHIQLNKGEYKSLEEILKDIQKIEQYSTLEGDKHNNKLGIITMRGENMEGNIKISERDLYCIARLLQSCLHGYNQFTGCKDCKYNCLIKKDYAPNFERVIFRLQDMTGVDFGVQPDEIPSRFKKDKSRCGDSDF